MKDMMIKPGEYNKPETISAERPQYPYGLRICLDDMAIKKLGIKELPEVGQKMKMMAMVEVCSTMENENKEGENYSMDLQIVAMELKGGKSEEKMEDSFYKK